MPWYSRSSICRPATGSIQGGWWPGLELQTSARWAPLVQLFSLGVPILPHLLSVNDNIRIATYLARCSRIWSSEREMRCIFASCCELTVTCNSLLVGWPEEQTHDIDNSTKVFSVDDNKPDPWRNGSASDSRSEGCVFDSRRVQTPDPYPDYPFPFVFLAFYFETHVPTFTWARQENFLLNGAAHQINAMATYDLKCLFFQAF